MAKERPAKPAFNLILNFFLILSKLFEMSLCEQVTRINEMIEALKEAKRKFEEDRAAAQAEYEAKINEMNQQYEQVKRANH